MKTILIKGANSTGFIRKIFDLFDQGHVFAIIPNVDYDVSSYGLETHETLCFQEEPGWLKIHRTPLISDAPAQITFSSGTTGKPKAILLSHRALSDVVMRVNDIMEVDSSIREYIGIPITFSFGLGRCRAVAAAGGDGYIPPNGFDPVELKEMLEEGLVNAVSAVPTLWRIVLKNKDLFESVGLKVRWIEIGSQYMSGEEKAALKALFPVAKIVQHYGLTEASRSTFLTIHDHEGEALESVGSAFGEVLIDLDTQGRIRIKGPHVSNGILGRSGLIPLTDEDGWLTTQDQGYIKDGLLYYEGRTDELINCGGVKIDPTQFERRLIRHIGDHNGLAVGRLNDFMRGEIVLIGQESSSQFDQHTLENACKDVTRSYGLTGNGTFKIAKIPYIPRTETGKIQRNQLADLIEASDRSSENANSNHVTRTTDTIELLRDIWARALSVDQVSVYDNFYDLGGDSLTALTVIAQMESLGIEHKLAREILNGRTIAEIAGSPEIVLPNITSRSNKQKMTHQTLVEGDIALSKDTEKLVVEIIAIWKEVLALDFVATSDNFYDVGGDSLTAQTAMLKMEAAGMTTAQVRGLLEGRTIRELAQVALEEMGEADNLYPNETEPKTLLETSVSVQRKPIIGHMVNSVHGARGFLALWVVTVHWLPGALSRLFENGMDLYRALWPLWKFGTPGFALVFGVGVGLLSLHQYQNRPQVFVANNSKKLLMLSGGILVLAAVRFTHFVVQDVQYTHLLMSELFYSVLVYYLLAILLMPLTLRLISLGKREIENTVALGLICLVLHETLAAALLNVSLGGLPELIKVTISAKYGFFKMTSITCLGIITGMVIRNTYHRPHFAKEVTYIGTCCLIVGGVTTYQYATPTVWSDFGEIYLGHLSLYFGAVLLVIASFISLNFPKSDGSLRQSPVFVSLRKGAAIIGVLSFPVFVGHELVLPIIALLKTTLVAEWVAIALSLGSFFVFIGYLGMRIGKYIGH